METDSLKRIKHIAYCISQMPPDSEQATLMDLVAFAKHQLCMEKRRLYYDPIWDRYTDEQILIEYYALSFFKNEELRTNYEAGLDSTNDFFDQKIQKNRSELAESNPTSGQEAPDEDGFTFEPGKI